MTHFYDKSKRAIALARIKEAIQRKPAITQREVCLSCGLSMYAVGQVWLQARRAGLP